MGWELISTYEYVWIVFGLFSFFIHVFTLHAILQAKIKKSEQFFKGPFFTIVLLQGFHECLMFLVINMFNRCRKYRIIYYAVEEDNILYEWEWYCFIFLRILLYFGHVQIALNRFTAFYAVNVGKYDKIWNKKTIILLTILSYTISSILRVVNYSPSFKFTTNIEAATGLFGAYLDTKMNEFDSKCDICLSIGSASICAVLYLASAWKAKRLNLSSEAKKHEITMLWCGFLTFIIVIPSAIRSTIDLTATINQWEDLRRFISRGSLYPTEAMTIFQPWMLLLSCPSLRVRVWNLLTCKTSLRLNIVSVSSPSQSN